MLPIHELTAQLSITQAFLVSFRKVLAVLYAEVLHIFMYIISRYLIFIDAIVQYMV